MNQTQEIEIFSTGMTTDLRKVIRVNRKILRPFQSLQHFDVYPDRLVPKRDWVKDTGAIGDQITQFEIAIDNASSSYVLWGLGLNGVHPFLAKKSSDLLSGSWSTVINGSTTFTGVTDNVTAGNPWLFTFNGNLYFPSIYNGGQVINQYNIATSTMTEHWQQSYGAVSIRPVFHPYKGMCYFATANSLYQLDQAGGWTLVMTVTPTLLIKSITVDNNNLAIGCAPLDGFSNSFVLLWDMKTGSTPATTYPTETVDWGKGSIAHLTNVRGTLVGITNEFIDSSTGINKGRAVTRTYAGVASSEVNYLTVDAVTAAPISTSVFRDVDKMYFAASFPYKTDTRIGVWSVDGSGNFLIELIGPTVEVGNRISTAFRVGEAWYIVFANGNVYRTNDQASFSLTSILETAAYGDRINSTAFFGATVAFEKLLSGQSVALKYKLPEDTAWSTAMKATSTSGVRQLQIIADALMKVPNWTEYQFRVESVGATITGLAWTTEPVDTNIYG